MFYDKVFALTSGNDLIFAFILNDSIRYDNKYQYDFQRMRYFMSSSKVLFSIKIFLTQQIMNF